MNGSALQLVGCPQWPCQPELAPPGRLEVAPPVRRIGGRCDGLIRPRLSTRQLGCDGWNWSQSIVITDGSVIMEGAEGEVEGGVVCRYQT
jgi:hypothetical protein